MKILLILLAGLWLLPTAAQRPDYAVVNVSVCNTRTAAEYSSGQESQALLGMPVKILDRHHEWTRILTPDHYEAWVLSGCIHPWNASSSPYGTKVPNWWSPPSMPRYTAVPAAVRSP